MQPDFGVDTGAAIDSVVFSCRLKSTRKSAK
jgi:hypothetical protein